MEGSYQSHSLQTSLPSIISYQFQHQSVCLLRPSLMWLPAARQSVAVSVEPSLPPSAFSYMVTVYMKASPPEKLPSHLEGVYMIHEMRCKAASEHQAGSLIAAMSHVNRHRATDLCVCVSPLCRIHGGEWNLSSHPSLCVEHLIFYKISLSTSVLSLHRPLSVS